MDLDDGGIDHGVFHVGLIRDGIEKPFENITLDPVAIPLEDGVPRTEQRRQIAPGAAGSRDPQHRLDKPTIVFAAASRVGLLPQAMRLHLCPLGIAQHISFHPKLESQYLAQGNPKSQQTLDDEASTVFAERHGNYRRGVPSVPQTYRRIGDGSVIEIGGREWRVIIGEGHAPEHACLYCAEARALIAGDQVLPRISPNISVQTHEPEGDPLARYLASLKKLRAALPPDILVLPSHNLPFYGVHERIDELAAHHAARCDEVIAACARPSSAADLLPVLFRRQLDRHQMGFALGEALAHLHYLETQGALSRHRDADGIDRFLAAALSLIHISEPTRQAEISYAVFCLK